MGKSGSKREISDDEIKKLRQTVDFSEDEIRRWYQGFHDACPKGKMTKAKFAQVYSEIFKTGDVTFFAGHVFRTFDKNKDDFLDFREFIEGLSIISCGTREDKLRWAFEMYNVDGGLVVTKKEMLEIVKSIFQAAGAGERVNLPSDENTPQKLTNKIFAYLDRNDDGTITLNEFVNGATKYPTFMKMLENPASVR